ncbi:MAG: hypothetical protein ACXVBW_10440, partial [Bdellovibrionota bacterium]
MRAFTNFKTLFAIAAVALGTSACLSNNFSGSKSTKTGSTATAGGATSVASGQCLQFDSSSPQRQTCVNCFNT